MNTVFKIFIFFLCTTFVLCSSAFGNDEKFERKNLLTNSQENLDKAKGVAEKRLINFKQRKQEALKALALSSKSRSEIFAKTLSLEAEFEKNDIELKNIQQRTKERANELSAFYQSLNEAVSMLRLDLKNSLLAAQYPERILFLEGLSESLKESNLILETEVLEEFSQLALQLIKDSEMIEVFWANLIDQDGRKTRDKITRLGRFNATRGTDYLYFEPGSYDLTILTRQPASRFKKYTFTEEQASKKIIPLAIDPSRGQVLSLLMLKPTTMDRIKQGGAIGLVIIFLGITALSVTLTRLKCLTSLEKIISRKHAYNNKKASNPLVRLSKIAKDHEDEPLEVLEIRLEEGLTSEYLSISKQISYVKFIAVVSPLLGLLGTVSGMILTFQSISLSGTNDPNLMAGGISQALVTTVLGLCVAIPSLLFYTILSDKVTKINDELERYAFAFLTAREERETS